MSSNDFQTAATPCIPAFILIILITIVVDKATVGAGQLTPSHPAPGVAAPSPALSGLEFDKAASEAVLTPSEVVYLAGDRFVSPGGTFSGYRLAGSDVSVSKQELAQQVYAAAFLAAEKAGALHLAIRPKQTLLGLRTVQALYAEPTGRMSPYPFNSLESHLLPLCSGPNEVRRVFHDLIPECADPFARADHLVGEKLADRGLLEVSRAKHHRVFSKTVVRVPERTATVAAGRVSEVQSLLRECQETRTALWTMLIDSISKGISSRQQQNDGPNM